MTTPRPRALIALVLATVATGGVAGLPPGQPPLNVLLLTVDTFRPDRLGVYGDAEADTPNLDRFAAESAIYTEAFATSSWTFPSLISVLTGTYPARHGYVARGRQIRTEVPTLLALLKGAGYRVPDLSYVGSIPGLEALAVDDRWPRPVERDRTALHAWLESEAAREGPFFAWYHWRTLHLPYAPESVRLTPERRTAAIEQVQSFLVIPASLQGFSPREQETVSHLYDGEVREFDAQFGELMTMLERAGLADNTVVVVTADHGEELFEHGLLGHASTTLHGTLFDEVLRVPLLMRVPGRAARRVGCMVSQIDVAPTLLGVLGLPAPDTVQGIDLSTVGDMDCPSRTLLAETIGGGFQAQGDSARTYLWSARTDRHKLIVRQGPDGAIEQRLFDLRADAAESVDVREREPQVDAALFAELERHWGAAGGRDHWREGVEESPGARNRAERLGASPTILEPADGATLTFEAAGAMVAGEWTGSPAARYEIQYDVGVGVRRSTGSFTVEGNRFAYGPIPQEVWVGLPEFNPWRFRVVPLADPDRASAWIEISFR